MLDFIIYVGYPKILKHLRHTYKTKQKLNKTVFNSFEMTFLDILTQR